MSDTPRTDALLACYSGTSASFTYLGELEKLARQLERQRNALDDALRERDKQLIAAIAERDALRLTITLSRI